MSRDEVRSIRNVYPAVLRPDAAVGEDRDVHHVALLAGLAGSRGRILDLGGGFAAHNMVLARRGMSVTVVDGFTAYWADRIPDLDGLISGLASSGVHAVDAPLEDWKPPDGVAYDVVFTAHCLEHFHRSPLPLLRRCLEHVRPGGSLVICVPNAVNLRKRVGVVRGHTNLSSFDEFFLDEGRFTGHVREFSVDDLRRLGAALGLRSVEISGRNWLGRSRVSGHRLRPAIDLLDRGLQLRPALCSDLYLTGVIGDARRR